MTVFVGVVTFNSASDLPRCFAALRAQTYSAIRLFVWDNASTDQTAAWLEHNASDVRLFVSNDNLGYGRAHNALMQAANLQADDYYLALNPDAELTPEYVARLVGVLARQPDAGWVTGKILQVSEDMQSTRRSYSAGHGLLRSGFAFNIGYGLADGEAFAHDREVFGAPGAAVLYKSSLIADISEAGNFFDPCMFMYAEDTDVDWRAQLRGWRCWYVAGAVAFHRGSSSTGQLKIMAVTNRYVSVLKNAALFDLLTYNLPYIAAHCLVRLLVTPRLGTLLSTTILRNAPGALRSRRFNRGSRASLRAWYRWSASQPTMQRSGLAQLRQKYSSNSE